MDLIPLLKDALSSDSNLIRESEKKINLLAKTNFSEFLFLISDVLSNESEHKSLRQISATIIKNILNFNQEFKEKWLLLNENSKIKIKDRVLSTLASNEKDVRKAAALTVVGIAKIEIPNNKWLDLFDILSTTAQNDNKNIRLSSITTIGYIGQEFIPKEINIEQIGKLAGAIYKILLEDFDEDILQEGISAFILILPHLKDYFSKGENKEYRSVFIKGILQKISHENYLIRKSSFSCLIEIARFFYDFLDEYIEDILNISSIHLAKDNEQIGIFTYEIWCTIAEIEISLITNNNNINENNNNNNNKFYCQKNYPKILQLIYFTLENNSKLITNFEEDKDDWNISKSAICLLTLLSQCCDVSLINSVTEFISVKISDENPTNKEIAMLAFGALLSTNQKTAMTDIVFSSVETIIKFLKSSLYPNSLKKTTSWVLLRIAKFFGEIFIANPLAFNELINEIIDIAQKATKRIACLLTSAIHFFAKNIFDENNLERNLFSPHTKRALDALLNMAFISNAYDSQNFNNIASEAFYAIGAILQFSTFSCKEIIEDFFINLIQAFENTFNSPFFSEEKKRNDYQEYISHCFFCGFSNGFIQLSSQSALHIARIITQSFENRNGIYEEGLIAISKSSLVLGNDFELILKESSFGNYLIFALKNTQDIALCKSAIISTTEIIQALQENFVNFAEPILNLIYDILLDGNVYQNLKPYCFLIFTDLFMNCPDYTFLQIGKIFDFVMKAVEAGSNTNFKDDDDQENLEYLSNLREKLVECIHIIFIVIKDNNKSEDFRPFVGKIIEFLNKNIIRDSLGIISDLCTVYKQEIKDIIDFNLINKMVNNLRKMVSRSEYERYIKLIESGIKNTIY